MSDESGNGLATLERRPQVLAPQRTPRSEMVSVTERGIKPETMADLWLMSQRISESGLAPKGMEKPETIFVALEMGMELGLPMMSALRNIAVINGRPSIWGDAALALVQSTGLLEDFDEYVDGEGDNQVAVVSSKRKGRSKPVVTRFSVADAKKAGLWGKQGPWSQYAPRMLKLRARGFNLRDNFPDVLQGLYTAEEAQDIPAAPITHVSAVPNPLNKLNEKLAKAAPVAAHEAVNVSTGEIIDVDAAPSEDSSQPPVSHEADTTTTESAPSAAGESVAKQIREGVWMDAQKFENLLVEHCIENQIAESLLNERLTAWCKKLGGGKLVKMEKLSPNQRKALWAEVQAGTFFA